MHEITLGSEWVSNNVDIPSISVIIVSVDGDTVEYMCVYQHDVCYNTKHINDFLSHYVRK